MTSVVPSVPVPLWRLGCCYDGCRGIDEEERGAAMMSDVHLVYSARCV